MRVFDAMGREFDANQLYNSKGEPLATAPDTMAKGQHGIVGVDDTTPSSDIGRRWPQFAGYNEIVTQFIITIELGGEADAAKGGSVNLRPEPFVCKRITYATDGDVGNEAETPNPYNNVGILCSSVQARVVECKWSDEFTQFTGDEFALVAALFGDSNGFLDLPEPFLLQGKQSPKVNLRRLRWPFTVPDEEEAPTTRWDFVLHGVGLLPPGVYVSGSAPSK